MTNTMNGVFMEMEETINFIDDFEKNIEISYDYLLK